MATIDVGEILKASTRNNEPAVKRAKLSVGGESAQSGGPSSSGNRGAGLPTLSNPDAILAALEDDAAQATTIDENHVRRLMLQLDRKLAKNREMRIKHPDEPQKFLESEFELNTAIQEMHALATQPELYTVFVEAGGPLTIAQLLAHENSDIFGATAHLLQELTDVDILNESEEGAAELIEGLAAGKIVELFVSAFERLDESNKDDADALQYALSVVENMMDFRSQTVDDCVNQGLFNWLLKRACQKGPFDGSKMYASELLATLLQMSDLAKKKLTEKLDGIDMLLRALAAYKKHDPASLDEREHMENLFDGLCASLMLSANRRKFLDGEGLQLMNLMLREKKQSRESALKVLDHATTGPEGRDNCDKFVEILGLRTLFPLFMRSPAAKKRKDTSLDEHEEHVCAILSSLLRSCNEEARQRMMAKFVEHEHEKVDRAIELLLKYKEKLAKYEAKRAKRKQNAEEGDDPDREYLDKLDNGLYTLQLVTLILTDVCVSTPSACARVQKLFSMKLREENIGKILIPILSEYRENLGEEANEERKRVDGFVFHLTKINTANGN